MGGIELQRDAFTIGLPGEIAILGVPEHLHGLGPREIAQADLIVIEGEPPTLQASLHNVSLLSPNS